MKKTIFFLFLLLPALAAGQSKVEKKTAEIAAEFETMRQNFTVEPDSIVKFSRVIQCPGMSPAEIFVAAQEAFARIYTESRAVIKTADKDAGLIFGKGVFENEVHSTFVTRHYTCDHRVKMEARDGRCRVTLELYDFRVEFNDPANFMEAPLVGLYPFWADCPPKKRGDSFDFFKLQYDNAMQTLASFEAEITKARDDDW